MPHRIYAIPRQRQDSSSRGQEEQESRVNEDKVRAEVIAERQEILDHDVKETLVKIQQALGELALPIIQ